jgi:hypothetical protein
MGKGGSAKRRPAAARARATGGKSGGTSTPHGSRGTRSAGSPAAREPTVRAMASGTQQPDAPAQPFQRGTGSTRPVARRRPPHGSRRAGGRAKWWKRYSPTILTVGSVALLIGLFVFIARSQSSGGTAGGSLAPPAVLKAVTQVSPQVFAGVNTGGLTNPIQAPPPAVQLSGASGKPEILYIGAEYCPYCAAERWSVVVALSRFGTFTQLPMTTSSSTDVYPDTATFTFSGSRYSSQYLDFVAVEETTRDPNTPLQTPTAQQQSLFARYDAPPYTTTAGGIPLFDLANQYLVIGPGYSPQVLRAGPSPSDSALSQQQIASKLSNANDPVTQAIVGDANYLTAALCTLTNNQPANVCTAGPIPHIEQQLPKGH